MTTTLASQTVTWNQAQLPFCLTADSAEVIGRARVIFRWWQMPAEDGVAPLPQVNQAVAECADGYHFNPSQPELTARAFSRAADLMRALETDAALAILNHHQHFLTVHGALLARGNRAVLIVGPSQAGKSTTSCALWAAGWQLLADDVTILHPAARAASPLLRRVSLRHPSRALLGDDFWHKMTAAETCDPTPEGYVFHPDEIEGRSRARTVELAAVLFLKRLGAPAAAAPASLSPIAPVQALLALAPYTNCVRHGGMGEAMGRLGPLINAVPAYDLARGPLPDMIATIETLMPGEVA